MVQPAHNSPRPRAREAPRDFDQIVVLDGVTWADYQRILEIRGDRSGPRIAYAGGRLELMSPSRSHESIKSMIGCLVEAWCMETGVDISPYGAWTLEDKEANGGLEPDECYVVGDDPDPERPDLAIEVIWTSGRIDKLELYRQLRVREVWIWKREQIQVYVLKDGEYTPQDGSDVLPGLDLAQLLRFIDVTPMTRAVREYRAALAQ